MLAYINCGVRQTYNSYGEVLMVAHQGDSARGFYEGIKHLFTVILCSYAVRLPFSGSNF